MLNFILLSLIFAAQAYGLHRTVILIAERNYSWFPTTALGFIRIASWASWPAAVVTLLGVFFAPAADAPQTLTDGYVSYFLPWLILIFIAVGIWSWLAERGEKEDENHLRGARLVDASRVIKQIHKQKLDSRLTIGGVPIPVKTEDRGFLFAGSQGTGKSQALAVVLDKIKTDGGHRAVVADPTFIFCRRYFSPADAILNPFDSRSVAWSPLAEIREPYDCVAMAKSIIPDGHGSSAEWHGYAQTLLRPILEHCWTGNLTNANLFHLTCVADMQQLREVLAGTPAAPLVAEGNERMFGSVRTIMSRFMEAYEYLDPAAGVDAFSIRDFIAGGGSGWLFLPYTQGQRTALRPLIQCALDVASRTVLDMPPAAGDRSRQSRTWFVLDEFPLLGVIQSVETLLTNGSKHGAVVLAGIQTIAQMVDTYGREKAQTLLACLGTWLTLRVNDAETAEYMSRYLGDEEIRRVVQSGGTSGKAWEAASESKNWTEQHATQRAVLPSELQNLPDLCGYLNIAGDLPLCPVLLPLAEQRGEAAPDFLPAPPRPRVKPAPAEVSSTAEATEIETTDLPFTL